MKRGVLYILIFLILISTAYSEGYSKEIFDEWYSENDTVHIGSNYYDVDEIFINDSDEHITIIDQEDDDNEYKLELDKCKKFGVYNLCIEDFEDNQARLKLEQELIEANVSIEGKIIIDKFYNTKQTFKVRDINYIVDYRTDAEKLHLKADSGTSPLLSYGQCKEYDTLKFCFTGLKLDIAKGIGIITPSGKEIPQAHVVVFEKQPSINVERTFSNKDLDELKLNEEVEVEVTIENKGDISANNLKYMELFPPEFEIKGTPSWEGQLASRSKKIIRFYIKAIDDFEGDIQGKVNYKFNGVNETIALEPIKIKTVATTIKISIENEEMRLNDKTMINIESINEEQNTKQFSFEIALPANLKIINTKLEKSGEYYIWEGEIDAKAKKYHTIQVQLINDYSKGNITLTGIANKKEIVKNILVKPKPKDIEFTSFVNVDNKKLTISLINNARYTFSPVEINVDNTYSKIIKKFKSNTTEEVIFENYEKLKPFIEIKYHLWGEKVTISNNKTSESKYNESDQFIYYGDDETNITKINKTNISQEIPEEYKDSKPETIETPPSNKFFPRLWRFFKGFFA